LHDNPPRRRLPGFHGTGKAARAAWGVPDPGRWPFTSTGGKIMGKESLLDRLLGRLEGVADWVNRAPGYVRVLVSAVIAALLVLLVSCANPAHAGEPADNGAHSSPETAMQGFVVMYAPVQPPALVFYWYTYNEDGEQAWFISDNVPVDAPGSEQLANIYKPMGAFVSDDGVRGDAVGVIGISRQGSRIAVRFGINPIDGFTDGCAADLPQLPQASPLPPQLPADEYPCQGRLVLSRISPVIPELLGEP